MQTAIHIVILPLELLHLLWMAATGELGSTVCFWTWISGAKRGLEARKSPAAKLAPT
jgi:hypothetical protein